MINFVDHVVRPCSWWSRLSLEINGYVDAMVAKSRRYELIEVEVTGWTTYGILVRTAQGEVGFIEDSYVVDGGIFRDDWPPAEASVSAVVLGVTRDGRLRLTSRATDIDLVASGVAAAEAMDAWQRFRDSVDTMMSDAEVFWAIPGAVAVVRWALLQPSWWGLESDARRLLALAPSVLQEEIGGTE